MKALPVEYRHRVVALTEQGYTSGAIAAVLGTSTAWVRSIKALHRSGQPLEPKSHANTRRSLADREGERIRAQVRAKPGTTLEDLKRDLALTTSISNLWNALRALKISLKKKLSRPPSGAARTWPPRGPSGSSCPSGSTPVDSSSSTRRSARPR